MPTDKPRFTITIDEELLERLEDQNFEKRCQNRTQALLELLRNGLDEYDVMKIGKQIKHKMQDR